MKLFQRKDCFFKVQFLRKIDGGLIPDCFPSENEKLYTLEKAKKVFKNLESNNDIFNIQIVDRNNNPLEYNILKDLPNIANVYKPKELKK